MSRVQPRNVPRQRQPELELAHSRPPSLGYEAPEESGLVTCLAHGFPTPLARWHFHDEYELHLITATEGKAFIGDWIGQFHPGHVVLCGSRLPHNWVSVDLPVGGVAERDLVIQFRHGPLARAAEGIPELAGLLPMFDRARHGIEFFGVGEKVADGWRAVKAAHGVARFAAFCSLMAMLAGSDDYRLLSSVQMQGEDSDAEHERISAIVDRIVGDVATPLTAGELAGELEMSESQFSRYFRRSTGNTFTEFVNRVRVSRACQLLMQTDRQVTDICFEVGFQNVANFNRRFRDIKGMTPSQFRHQADNRFAGRN